MSREDLRLRSFTPMRELKHALAARLSHLDYSREMALVAQHDGMTLGARPQIIESTFDRVIYWVYNHV